MASERFEGIVNELGRTGAGQEAVITFWLVAGDGTRALVETREDRPLRNGDRIEVFGERDSQGTLAATSVLDWKAPDSRAQPLQWGRILLSSVLSALISFGVALAFGYLLPDMFSHISFDRGLFRAINQGVIRFLLVMFVLFPAVFFVFPSVCAMAVTSKMVSYRRGPQALIAALISLPIYLIFMSLWASFIGENR
jgi:hypothetical protein